MIRINLLPVEKRKAERTPVPRFFLIVATAGTAAAIFFYIIYILLEINQVSGDIRQCQIELDGLRSKVAEFEDLTKQRTAAQNKLKEISSVITRDVDIGYWRAASALWDVLNRHRKVWIDDFKMLDAKAAQGELKRHFPDSKDAPTYGVAMRCHVASAEVREMTNFRNALKNHPVLMQCLPVINFNPDWKVDDEKGYAEQHSISFSVALFKLAAAKTAAPVKRGVPAAGGASTPPPPTGAKP